MVCLAVCGMLLSTSEGYDSYFIKSIRFEESKCNIKLQVKMHVFLWCILFVNELSVLLTEEFNLERQGNDFTSSSPQQ